MKKIPTYSGTLRSHLLAVPHCISECSGIRIFGRRIKSLVFTTDVAIIKNVRSDRMGKKDIIKIDGEMELDWDLIGYVDPSITVNIIRGGELQEKRTLKLPERIHGVLRCKNPRCITSTERELPQEFVLTDRERRVYRCLYCETEAGK